MKLCKVNGCSNEIYCGELCSKHYNRLRKTGTTDDGPKARASLETRFWRQVEKRTKKECWPWKAKAKVSGYGYLGLPGRNGGKILAHRYSYILHNGPIPNSDEYHGWVVMHRCDNRLCVNPDHLLLGTQQDNVTDMDEKGRRVNKQTAGSKHGNAKFNEEIVKKMRLSTLTDKEWAQKLGVTRQAVGYARRKGWQHV